MPALELEAGHVALALGGPGSGSLDLGLGYGLTAGVAGTFSYSDYYGWNEANYAAGRVAWRVPWGPLAWGPVLSVGRGMYYDPAATCGPPVCASRLSQQTFVQPALAWILTGTVFDRPSYWRFTLGPALGLDGRPWLEPILLTDVALFPPIPAVFNFEFGARVWEKPQVEAFFGGNNGLGLGARVRL
jgi:hypothetical protein